MIGNENCVSLFESLCVDMLGRWYIELMVFVSICIYL